MTLNDLSYQAPRLTVDFDVDGRQHGFIELTQPGAGAAYGRVRTPISVLRHGEGPVITIIGGVHGDEPEGSITLLRMARELAIDSVSGCLILLPCLNLPAVQQGQRLSQIDERDMDQVFPGTSGGSLNQRLAQFVSQQILPRSDLILDLRSGGGSMRFANSAVVHQHADKQLQKQAEASMIAFGAPNSVRLLAPATPGSLFGTAEQLGIPYVKSELGGGSTSSAETLGIAWRGCHNVMMQAGLLDAELMLCATRMLEVRDSDAFVIAPADGLFDIRARLGQEIWHGNLLAQLIDPLQNGAMPVDVQVPSNGALLALRHGGHVQAGDCLAIIADEVQR
ncbi:MAG: succinylglutamate desuccinylase/aspartoacylase family protein [Granulosicoccus sp.]